MLSDAEIAEALRGLPGWTRAGSAIKRTYRFPGFPEAVAFVGRLVAPAEAANHHPDLLVSYDKVHVTLTTHDAGGLTRKDVDLAQAIDRLVFQS